MLDVLPAAGEEVVEADDVSAAGEEALAEVRSNESGTAGDEHSHAEPEEIE
jgi:hypothetical protein